MRKVPPYTLQRVARDTDKPVTYDFEVHIDGEHRATFRKMSFAKGYDLCGPDGEPLTAAPVPADANEYYHRARVEKQADFVPLIDAMILANRFPTVEDFKARELGWGRALLETRDAKFADNLIHAVEEHARSFYDLAMLVAYGVNMAPGAKRLVAKVQKRHAELNDHQDEFYPPSKWEVAAIAAFTASLKTGDA